MHKTQLLDKLKKTTVYKRTFKKLINTRGNLELMSTRA